MTVVKADTDIRVKLGDSIGQTVTCDTRNAYFVMDERTTADADYDTRQKRH